MLPPYYTEPPLTLGHSPVTVFATPPVILASLATGYIESPTCEGGISTVNDVMKPNNKAAKRRETGLITTHDVVEAGRTKAADHLNIHPREQGGAWMVARACGYGASDAVFRNAQLPQ